MWGSISRSSMHVVVVQKKCTWFSGLDVKKIWAVLSGLPSGFAPCGVGHLNLYDQIGAPLKGLIFSRGRVVRGYGWLGDSAG